MPKLASQSLVAMTGAFLVWSLYFLAAYAWLSVGCAAGFAQTSLLGMDPVRLVLGALTLAAGAAIALYGWRTAPPRKAAALAVSADTNEARRPFMELLAAAASGLALIATLWVAAPIVLLAPCR